MAEVKNARPKTENDAVVDRAKDFWQQYGKTISIVMGAVIVIVGGLLIYNNFIKAPKERKAADNIAKVQNLYDSLYSAQGELQPRFLDSTLTEAERLISQYGGTKAGNLARFYAGSIYLKKGNFDKAVNHLKEFETDAPQIQAKAYKLLADAYAEQGKTGEAIDNYKKAANSFDEDKAFASEAMFLAAYLADKVQNDKSQAIELYKQVKTKFSQTQWGFEAEKYLAANGIYSVE